MPNAGGNGTAPEKTFTQEELDAIVEKRLDRERKKYSDYPNAEELKALMDKAAKFDEAEEKNKTDLEKEQEKSLKLQNELDALKKTNAMNAIRAKVAKEKGVPQSLLHGEDEESCNAEADALIAFKNPSTYPSVKDGGEPKNTLSGTAKDQFAEWFNNVIS